MCSISIQSRFAISFKKITERTTHSNNRKNLGIANIIELSRLALARMVPIDCLHQRVTPE